MADGNREAEAAQAALTAASEPTSIEQAIRVGQLRQRAAQEQVDRGLDVVKWLNNLTVKAAHHPDLLTLRVLQILNGLFAIQPSPIAHLLSVPGSAGVAQLPFETFVSIILCHREKVQTWRRQHGDQRITDFYERLQEAAERRLNPEITSFMDPDVQAFGQNALRMAFTLAPRSFIGIALLIAGGMDFDTMRRFTEEQICIFADLCTTNDDIMTHSPWSLLPFEEQKCIVRGAHFAARVLVPMVLQKVGDILIGDQRQFLPQNLQRFATPLPVDQRHGLQSFQALSWQMSCGLGVELPLPSIEHYHVDDRWQRIDRHAMTDVRFGSGTNAPFVLNRLDGWMTCQWDAMDPKYFHQLLMVYVAIHCVAKRADPASHDNLLHATMASTNDRFPGQLDQDQPVVKLIKQQFFIGTDLFNQPVSPFLVANLGLFVNLFDADSTRLVQQMWNHVDLSIRNGVLLRSIDTAIDFSRIDWDSDVVEPVAEIISQRGVVLNASPVLRVHIQRP